MTYPVTVSSSSFTCIDCSIILNSKSSPMGFVMFNVLPNTIFLSEGSSLLTVVIFNLRIIEGFIIVIFKVLNLKLGYPKRVGKSI